MKNGTWEKVKTTNKGKYVILETTGTQNTISLKYEQRDFNVFWLILIVLLVIAFLCVSKFKKFKRGA